jgi:tRNA-intron endonuclease
MAGVRKTVIKARKGLETGNVLSGDRVIVRDQREAAQLMSRNFGEQKGSSLYLNLYEACLLVEEGRLKVCGKKGPLNAKKLLSAGESVNDSFGMKYDVFKDLRAGRGYVVKSGIKFGCDFVVYPRGKGPADSHSRWMVHVMPESARLDYSEITRAARLATNVKKAMLFATVTERGPVYYEISRAKL